MIRHNTVLVLGAGASCPYGFPSGRTLIDKITHYISNEASNLYKQLINCDFKPNSIKIFSEALKGSPLSSIDVFLETIPEFSQIGRTSIAISLLPCESVDRLMDYPRSVRLKLIKGYEGEENSWYHYLFTHLHNQGHPLAKIGYELSHSTMTVPLNTSFFWLLKAAIPPRTIRKLLPWFRQYR